MTERKDFYYRFANKISIFFNPLWFGVFIFIWLVTYLDFTLQDKILVLISGLTAAVILPVFIVLKMVKSGKSVNIDIPEREKRMRPFAFFALVYLLDIIINYVLNLPMIFQIIMWIFLINTIVYGVITYWWKVSIHAAGLTGYITTLCFISGNYSLLFLIPIFLVGWSRVVLKAHTIAQVSVGTILGVFLTYYQIAYYSHALAIF